MKQDTSQTNAKFSWTVYAQNMGYQSEDDCYFVRHVYWDTLNRRCTAFYPTRCDQHADALADALNESAKGMENE